MADVKPLFPSPKDDTKELIRLKIAYDLAQKLLLEHLKLMNDKYSLGWGASGIQISAFSLALNEMYETIGREELNK